jgi:glycosyltransferase involved in cell wall biosynthesis
LRAFRQVLTSLPDIHLYVVGDGVERKKLRQLSDDLNIADNVTWLGALPHRKALRMYPMFDIVAVPSVYEAFGLTAIEAMAFNRPVLVTNVGSLTELVEHDHNGLVIDYGDVNRMAEAIVEILKNKGLGLRLGRAGRRKVEFLFGKSHFTENWLEVYDCLCTE